MMIQRNWDWDWERANEWEKRRLSHNQNVFKMNQVDNECVSPFLHFLSFETKRNERKPLTALSHHDRKSISRAMPFYLIFFLFCRLSATRVYLIRCRRPLCNHHWFVIDKTIQSRNENVYFMLFNFYAFTRIEAFASAAYWNMECMSRFKLPPPGINGQLNDDGSQREWCRTCCATATMDF